MPSFTSVTKLTRLPDLPNGAAHFSGVVDEVWSVNGSPHGGYLLGLVIYAINQFQASTDQPDIAHLMASFLRAARPGDIFLKVWIVKKGLRWTNLACEVWQKEQLLITNQALFTKMPPLPTHREPFSTTNQNLLPLTPSRYAPITPFLTHPSEDGEMKWSFDPKIKKQKEEGRSLDWGAWCEFERKEDKVDTGALGFFSDLMSSLPELLPPPERIEPHYYPQDTSSSASHMLE
ncbi:hypothetical protein MNV49_001539 [Pseudohyphozyma bogoriensis]|nr:hypothetical protein MNV49_001539 [Pseudohyphozyma bogoriensis]